MYDLILEAATIVRPEGRLQTDLAVEDGKIVYLGSNPGGPARRRIPAEGKLLLPGLIDTHIHFRDPGHPQKEDWYSGSCAAASGGVTTVCDMPNTSPPTISRANWEQKAATAAARSVVDYGIWVGAAAGNGDALLDLMATGDACGIKVFMGATTGPLLVDDRTLEEVFAHGQGLIGVHAEDEGMLSLERERWKNHPSPDHNQVRPPAAAVAAVRRLLQLSDQYHRAVHICHLSTAAELALLEEPRPRVTAEVCTHHLWLSTEDALGNWMKCNPPIREPGDVAALWQHLRQGKIRTLASDHAPHTREEKLRPYWEAPSGIPGVETTFSLMIRGVVEGRLSLEQLVEVGSEAPARLFGFAQKGRIEVGKDADLLLVGPVGPQTPLAPLREEDLLSRVGWSPFVGRPMAPRPEKVWVRGVEVAAGGKVLAPAGTGRRVQIRHG